MIGLQSRLIQTTVGDYDLQIRKRHFVHLDVIISSMLIVSRVSDRIDSTLSTVQGLITHTERFIVLIEPENSVVERGCKYQKTVRNQETIFPSERDCLYMNTPNGCPIILDETNYGNHGRLNAYYYTDSTRDDEYVTFDRFPYDLNWSNEAGLKVG